ncbi:MAG TPA: PDZ domain-containing protein [Gemmatimonadaceae bacterium]|nr:PDZ domain-containing protein [Gemmatimonadaceae bacterium]
MTGDIGLAKLKCVGASCVVNGGKAGGVRRHEFNTEPIVAGVEKGSPADGALRVGDTLMAVDGALITTRRAGERLANLQPGVPITLRIRRAGSALDLRLVPVRGCNLPDLSVIGREDRERPDR